MVAGKVLHVLAPAHPSDITSGWAHTLSLFCFLKSPSISLLHSLFFLPMKLFGQVFITGYSLFRSQHYCHFNEVSFPDHLSK